MWNWLSWNLSHQVCILAWKFNLKRHIIFYNLIFQKLKHRFYLGHIIGGVKVTGNYSYQTNVVEQEVLEFPQKCDRSQSIKWKYSSEVRVPQTSQVQYLTICNYFVSLLQQGQSGSLGQEMLYPHYFSHTVQHCSTSLASFHKPEWTPPTMFPHQLCWGFLRTRPCWEICWERDCVIVTSQPVAYSGCLRGRGGKNKKRAPAVRGGAPRIESCDAFKGKRRHFITFCPTGRAP